MNSEKIINLSLPYPNIGNRTIRVYIPSHEDGETFPVIYMTDGQSIFDEETATFGSWHVIDAIRDEQKNSGKSAIIVGIHNDLGPLQRANELTPKEIATFYFPDSVPEEIKRSLAPEGEIFNSFIIHTVMPAIESQFPVKTGRGNTAFCGSSSGGLFSFYTALRCPDKYCAAGVFSPCFMLYEKKSMADWIHSKMQNEMPYLYLYSGAADELEHHICESTEWTYDILKDCYPTHLLKKVIKKEQAHIESAWEPVFSNNVTDFLSSTITFLIYSALNIFSASF
ncbi:MAG: hypothetical protein II919_03745 [Lachnospiraceae bacterium]|nr:hypothetical protein [Lachnospiraceae bacterium]